MFKLGPKLVSGCTSLRRMNVGTIARGGKNLFHSKPKINIEEVAKLSKEVDINSGEIPKNIFDALF